MKNLFLIFALLIAGCDTNDPLPCKPVAIQISDANPIQFWPIDCDAYNEKEVCGVHPKCWCHPWQCNDEIKVQFTNTDPFEDFELNIYNDQESIVSTVLFTPTDLFLTEFPFQFNNSDFDFSISDWGNYSASPGSSAGWGWSAGSALADGTSGTLSQTYQLEQSRLNLGIGDYDKYPAGSYVFKLLIDNQSTGGSSPLTEGLTIRATDTLGVTGENFSGGTIARGGGFIEYTVSITTTQPWKYFTAQFTKQGPSSGSIVKIYINYFRIESYPLDYSSTVHETSFIPNDEGVCNEKIKLLISSTTSSPADVLKSDCIDIADIQKCTTLIEYSNNRNFAGLIYQDVSPEQTFTIRVPAIFFHEEFPEEDEAMDLTTGIVKTSGTIKAQRLFETDYMPYYMHRKLKLIFKHQTINIDALSWIKEEAYEIQPGDRRWPVKKAKCLLTENYIQRAVL